MVDDSTVVLVALFPSYQPVVFGICLGLWLAVLLVVCAYYTLRYVQLIKYLKKFAAVHEYDIDVEDTPAFLLVPTSSASDTHYTIRIADPPIEIPLRPIFSESEMFISACDLYRKAYQVRPTAAAASIQPLENEHATDDIYSTYNRYRILRCAVVAWLAVYILQSILMVTDVGYVIRADGNQVYFIRYLVFGLVLASSWVLLYSQIYGTVKGVAVGWIAASSALGYGVLVCTAACLSIVPRIGLTVTALLWIGAICGVGIVFVSRFDNAAATTQEQNECVKLHLNVYCQLVTVHFLVYVFAVDGLFNALGAIAAPLLLFIIEVGSVVALAILHWHVAGKIETQICLNAAAALGISGENVADVLAKQYDPADAREPVLWRTVADVNAVHAHAPVPITPSKQFELADQREFARWECVRKIMDAREQTATSSQQPVESHTSWMVRPPIQTAVHATPPPPAPAAVPPAPPPPSVEASTLQRRTPTSQKCARIPSSNITTSNGVSEKNVTVITQISAEVGFSPTENTPIIIVPQAAIGASSAQPLFRIPANLFQATLPSGISNFLPAEKTTRPRAYG